MWNCLLTSIQRAIENGANALAEGFLFTVAAGLILGEAWRSSRNESKRRDNVNDQLDSLGTSVVELTTKVGSLSTQWETELREERQKCVVHRFLRLVTTLTRSPL